MEKKAKSWWYNPADEYKKKAAEENSKKATEAVGKRADDELGDWAPSNPETQTRQSIALSATSSGDASAFNKKAQQFIYKYLGKWVNMSDTRAVLSALNTIYDDAATLASYPATSTESRAEANKRIARECKTLINAVAPSRLSGRNFNISETDQASFNQKLAENGTVGVYGSAWNGSKKAASKMQSLVLALANGTALQTPLDSMSSGELQSALLQAYYMLNTYGGKKFDSAREQISNALYNVMNAGADLKSNLDYHEMILRIAKSADAGGGAYVNESRYRPIEEYIAKMKPELDNSNGAAATAPSLADPVFNDIANAVKIISYTDGVEPMEKSAKQAYKKAQAALKKHFPKSGNPFQDAKAWLDRQNAAKAANEQGGQNG